MFLFQPPMLSATIQADMLRAMKEARADELSTLRLLRSALKNKEIDLQRPATDEEVQAVIRAQIKQLDETIETCHAAGRADQATAALRERTQLSTYLPAQLSDEALTDVVKAVLAEQGITDPGQAQKAMGAIMKRVAGQADGNRVKAILGSCFVLLLCVFAVLSEATPLFAVSLEHVAAPGTIAKSVSQLIETPTPIFDLVARVMRILLLVVGLSSITKLLHGGFTIMLASGREETHHAGFQSMMVGMLGTMFVFVMFVFSSVVIERLAL